MLNYLITGATSGIGKAVVHLLNEENHHLILVGRDQIRLNEISENLNAMHTTICCDLDDVSNLKDVLNILPDRIDGFVHCAGVDSTVPLKNITYEKFEKVFKVNFFSFLEIIKQISVTKKNTSDYWTSVVAVSSIASNKGGAGQTIYSSSKAALEAAVIVLSKELIKKKFRINCVRPGLVDTEMTRRWMKRIGIEDINELSKMQLSGIAKPEEIANVICFLLSPESTHILGQNITVDGGGPSSSIF